jgi:hypothetical protein
VAVSAAVDLSPRVKIAQSADLSTVMTYLGERARDEARGRVRGTRRAGHAHAASWRLRGVRVSGGRRFELVVIGPLDASRSLCQPSRNAVTVSAALVKTG